MAANSFKQMSRDGTIKRTDTGMFISLDHIHVRQGFNKREDDERTRQADDDLFNYLMNGGTVPPLEVIALYTAPPVRLVNTIDETLIEALRLVQCMLDDYRERNYGHAQEWIRHISAKMDDYSEQHGDDAYSVISAAIIQAVNSPATPDGWIPVSDRMPERDIDVQVFCADKKEQMVGYMERNETEGWFRFASLPNGGGVYCKPTHWMPLPAEPQQEVKP
ncbi:TPA: DUF551 domain-containing protein [Escherichia coli]|nr:DUF551 domain-containing protein [Escherichia coli]HAN4700263.1 DUF551 domain-containing protein [Escherichia coli]HDV3981655.1 DUF551 domain-containing protein [Escherichia coli]HDV4027447.1 DUF551 domain-containing protein [Escherichia coli]